MNSIHTIYQKLIPLSLRKQLAIKRRFQWQFDSRARTSRARMKQFKNKHKGERCFIMGNGPSLKKMDLSPLKNEMTFGLNRIYLLFPEIGFETTYLASVNPLVIEQFGSEIADLPMPKFIAWNTRDDIDFTSNTMFLRSKFGNVVFSPNAASYISEGYTVTYVAMQLAYYMGFETVYLIGVDHNFSTKGSANKTVTSKSNDPNHFHPDYFGKGYKWQLPDLDNSEVAYDLAKQYFEQGGRQILDATVGGKLQIFTKVDFNTLFE